MKVTVDNIKNLPIPKLEQALLNSLLIDLEDIQEIDPTLYIDWQDFHNEYSPERIDPCPDYYGYYTLRRNPYESIGAEMTIEDLDMCLFMLYEYLIKEQL